jgi:hypothetical protein
MSCLLCQQRRIRALCADRHRLPLPLQSDAGGVVSWWPQALRWQQVRQR